MRVLIAGSGGIVAHHLRRQAPAGVQLHHLCRSTIPAWRDLARRPRCSALVDPRLQVRYGFEAPGLLHALRATQASPAPC